MTKSHIKNHENDIDASMMILVRQSNLMSIKLAEQLLNSIISERWRETAIRVYKMERIIIKYIKLKHN